MKKIRNFLLTTLIIIIMLAFLMFVPDSDGEYLWNPFDYARITDVDYTAVVVDEYGSQGKVLITERLTFEVNAVSKNNLFWELWRDLPESFVDGVKVSYQVNSVKQIFDDGSELIYKESPKLYWYDNDYIDTTSGLGPNSWYHSKGPYNEDYRQYECVLFYVNGLYRETVVIEIEYEMYNAALRYNDASELYLSMYSDKTIKYLNSFKAQILIPEEKMPNSQNYYANTYGTNSHTFPFNESSAINPGYYTFFFELDESQLKFKLYNQYIEFALVSYGEDKHLFTEHASINLYTEDDVLAELIEEQLTYESLPAKWQNIKKHVLIIFSVLTVLITVFMLGILKLIKKKYTFYKSSIDIEYFRDIPSNLDPIVAAKLVFSKDKKTYNIENQYASVILSLINKGYIELDKKNANKNWEFDNIKIVIKYNPIILEKDYSTNLKKLTLIEETYFNLILRHSKLQKSIAMKTLKNKVVSDYQYTNSFITNIESLVLNNLLSHSYYQKLEYDKPKRILKACSRMLFYLGLFVLILFNIISYLTRLDLAFGAYTIFGSALMIISKFISKRSNKCILLSQFGEDEYAKWRGLYKFLNSETLMSDKTVIDLVLWEQYLIYATAFGISEKVAKALEIRCQNIKESPVLYNYHYTSRSFRFSAKSFNKATKIARAKSFSSGGHGGYGGGGRGGGGGGGGH